MARTFGPLGFCGCELRRREKQIPEGMTDKKSKGNGNSNDGLAFVVSHPSRKNKSAARMGRGGFKVQVQHFSIGDRCTWRRATYTLQWRNGR